MRGTLRFLLWIVLSSSLALAAVPRQPLVPAIEKTDCCAKLKAESPSHECDRHAPKSNPDQQGCAVCTWCLAGVLAPARPFVYPPVGDETFAAYISFEHSRSQRPPVPPPRT